MVVNIKEHMAAHSRNGLSLRSFIVAMTLLLAAFFMHLFAHCFNQPLLLKAAIRLYYIPVLYLAFTGGFLAGFVGFLVTAIAYICVMYFMWSIATLSDYLFEIIMLFGAGIGIGLLKDHEAYERSKRYYVQERFGKYISAEIVDQILSNKKSFSGASSNATVMFSDIRGFTNLAEGLEPQVLLSYLNKFFSEMVKIILENNGYIDKFIGDSVMAVFGLPVSKPGNALNAVHSAVRMQASLKTLNHSGSFGNSTLEMGIGLHSGQLVAGNIGSSERMEYTVIGDTVNLASRIESLNKTYGTHILISDAIYREVCHDESLLLREVDSVRVKGRRSPIVLYEVFNCCAPQEIERKQETFALFYNAMLAYKNAHWESAHEGFAEIYSKFPEDKICKIYIERIKKLQADSMSADHWDGVFNA